MSRFDDLHAQFVVWDAARAQYEQQAEMVMLAFYNGFRQYLGRDPATDELVSLCAIDHSSDGISKFVSVDHFSKALSEDTDGTWQFGISITMTEGELFSTQDAGSVIIKRPSFGIFFVNMRFTLQDSECLFQNAADPSVSFPCKFENQALYGPPDAYSYLAELLEKVFHLKPGEPANKLPIGFDTHRRDN